MQRGTWKGAIFGLRAESPDTLDVFPDDFGREGLKNTSFHLE